MVTHISEDDSRDANLDVHGLTPREILLSASSSCKHHFCRWASHRARDCANTHSAKQATIIQLVSTHITMSKWQCTVSSRQRTENRTSRITERILVRKTAPRLTCRRIASFFGSETLGTNDRNNLRIGNEKIVRNVNVLWCAHEVPFVRTPP